MEEPFVSVVVPTRNRAPSLARTLAALSALDYPSYEVVVVDNASTDHTAEVISAFSARYIDYPEPNISACRQRGVEAARGDVIAMCDDDCVPNAMWLRNLVRCLCSDRNIALVGGRIVNVGFPERARNKGLGRIGRNGQISFVSDPQSADYFGAANQAFRKPIFQAVGGYDPFFRSGYEEVDLMLRLRRAGFQALYEQRAVVEHYFTGAGHKLRFFYSGATMRLYFYLKHFRPQTLSSWLDFLGYELWLMGKEFLAAPYRLVRTALRGRFGRWPELGMRWANALLSRLAIPWLMWKTHPSRFDLPGERV